MQFIFYASYDMSSSWQTTYLALNISFRLNFGFITVSIRGFARAKAVIISVRWKQELRLRIPLGYEYIYAFVLFCVKRGTTMT